MIIVISMIFTSGCTNVVIATECNRCEIGSDIMEKTSVITVEKNDPFTDSPDNDRLHIKDSDGIIYSSGPTARFIFDLDEYNGKEVTFKYHCSKDGYYQLMDIDYASSPCNCKQFVETTIPVPTPKIVHTGCDYVCTGTHMNCTYVCETRT